MTKVAKSINTSKAFTIVELLIVIVVIGILAAITIVAYNGIQNRAKIAGLQHDLNQASKSIENAKTVSSSSTYPADQAGAVAAGMNSGITYTYNSATATFCATKTDGGQTMIVSANNKTPRVASGCTLTNLITNPSAETDIAIWARGSNNPVPSRVNTYANSGSWSMQSTHTSGTSAGFAYAAIPINGLTIGQPYTVSFSARSVSGTPSLTPVIQNGSVGGAYPATYTPWQTITPSTTWTRYTLSWTADATSAYLTIDYNGPGTGESFVVDSVMATVGPNAATYYDGSSTGWAWSGTTNLSTSTGPAF